jgi:hypothetical protein
MALNYVLFFGLFVLLKQDKNPAQRLNRTSKRPAGTLRGMTKTRSSAIIAWADKQFVRLRVYRSDSRSLVKLQSLLAAVAVATAVLAVLTGVVIGWINGGSSRGLGVDILWWILWILYTIAKVVLFFVLYATIRQWLISRRSSPVRS